MPGLYQPPPVSSWSPDDCHLPSTSAFPSPFPSPTDIPPTTSRSRALSSCRSPDRVLSTSHPGRESQLRQYPCVLRTAPAERTSAPRTVMGVRAATRHAIPARLPVGEWSSCCKGSARSLAIAHLKSRPESDVLWEKSMT